MRLLADKSSVISLVKGIKFIIGVVLKESEGNADATKFKMRERILVNCLEIKMLIALNRQEGVKASASVGEQ